MIAYKTIQYLEGNVLGASSGVGPPDPIPNSAVKHSSADGTSLARGRVGQCREHFLSNRFSPRYPLAGFVLYWTHLIPFMEDHRLFKRIVVIVGYLVFFAAIVSLIYVLFFRVAPTCTDGIRNQNETGIDCGGSCTKRCDPPLEAKALLSEETAFVPVGDGAYDVLVKVHNPNDIAGASSFSYAMLLKDASGRVLAKRVGHSFILPQETKYLLEFQIPSSVVPEGASVEFSDIKWDRFEGYTEKPRVSVVRQSYARITSGPGYGAATGLVINESPYDFRSLSVKVVLRDASGKPIAVNMTEMRTMKSKEQRDFRLVWPSSFPGEVASYEMLVDADIYHVSNFIKQYSPTTPF